MASKEEQNNALVTLPVDIPQLPDLQGKTGKATVKASEEQSSVAEMHKQVSKDLGNKHIEQKGHKIQKQDSTKTAEASIKTTNEGGVRRTVATTVVTSSSSFEEEETMEQTIKSGPIKWTLTNGYRIPNQRRYIRPQKKQQRISSQEIR